MAEPVRRDAAAVQDIRAEHDDDEALADFDSVGVQRTYLNAVPHGFRENHAGRRVFNIDTHYFVISRRYICHSCKEAAAAAVKAAVVSAQSPLFAAAPAAAVTVHPAAAVQRGGAAAVAAAAPPVAPAGGAVGGVLADGAPAVAAAAPPVAPEGVVVGGVLAGGAAVVAAAVQPGALASGAAATDDDSPGQYTFMGWEQRSIAYLPFGYGEYFPAFLTYRSGVDKGVIHLMRPLFDAA